MYRSQGPGHVFAISVEGEEWLFDPQPKGRRKKRASEDSKEQEARVIDVIRPNHEIFGMTLPHGTEHPQFSDDQMVSMAVGCLGMMGSRESNRHGAEPRSHSAGVNSSLAELAGNT